MNHSRRPLRTKLGLPLLAFLGAGVVFGPVAVFAGEDGRTEASEQNDKFFMMQLKQTPEMEESSQKTPVAEAQELDFAPHKGYAGESSGKEASQARAKLRDLLEGKSAGGQESSEAGNYGAMWTEGSDEAAEGWGEGLNGGFSREVLRRLDDGLRRAYGKSYYRGWEILNDEVRQALRFSRDMPPPLAITLEAGRRASSGKGSQDSWEILHTVVKGVLENSHSFYDNKDSAFRQGLRIARLAGYDKSYYTGWDVTNSMLGEYVRAGSRFFTKEVVELTVDQLRRASSGKSSSDAWKILDAGIKMAERRLNNLGHFFDVCYAVGNLSDLSSYTAYDAMNGMMRSVRTKNKFYPNEMTHRVLLAGTNAAQGKSSSDARRILFETAKALRNALKHPRDYFRVGYEVPRQLSSSYTQYETLREFGRQALDSNFLRQGRNRDQFRRDMSEASRWGSSRGRDILVRAFQAMMQHAE